MLLGCGSRLRQLFEVPLEARAQHATVGAVGAGSREHHEVPRGQRLVLAKSFAGETLELVAIHGSSRGSA